MNAQLLFKNQGQANVQPKDFRTLTEKLADVVKLRVTLRKELLQITDDTNAGQIIEQANDLEIQYIAQQMPALIKFYQLQKALGVEADIFLAKVRNDMIAVNRLALAHLGVGVGGGGDDDDGGGDVLFNVDAMRDKIGFGQLQLLRDEMDQLEIRDADVTDIWQQAKQVVRGILEMENDSQEGDLMSKFTTAFSSSSRSIFY